MASDSVRIVLRGSEEMEACREALIESGVDTEAVVVQELEVFALRDAATKSEVSYRVIPQEADMVLEALREELMRTPYDEQARSIPWRILDHVSYIPAQAA